MKEHSIAISASLMFHIVIVALFLNVPFDKYVKPKLMVLDFSLEKARVISDRENGKRETEIGNRKSEIVKHETQIVNRKSQIVSRTTENEGTIMNREQIAQRSFVTEAPLAKQNNGNTIASDLEGKVTVHTEAGPTGGRADSTSESNISVGKASPYIPASSGNIRIVDYGRDGSGVKDFPFINDTLRKRFQNAYPERAYEQMWEGEVLLSFIISENGVVQDVQVVHSSGYRTFDNHAKKMLKETSFNKKLPYSLRINDYKVTYKLQ
jgi:TonB family protein